MCRRISTSVTTFLVSLACMTTALALRPTPEIKYLTVFVLTYTTMQLVDALIWHGIRTNNTKLNAFTSTYIVPLVLSAELIVAYYAAVYFLGWSNSVYEATMWVVVAALWYTWICDCLKDPVTKANKDGYLVWCNYPFGDFSRLIFLIFLLLPGAIALRNGWIKASAITTALIMWLWNYGNSAFGSRWCWSSNFVSIIILFLVLVGAT